MSIKIFRMISRGVDGLRGLKRSRSQWSREWKIEGRKWLEMEQEEGVNGVNQKYLI